MAGANIFIPRRLHRSKGAIVSILRSVLIASAAWKDTQNNDCWSTIGEKGNAGRKKAGSARIVIRNKKKSSGRKVNSKRVPNWNIN